MPSPVSEEKLKRFESCLTISEFCKLEKISPPTYYELKKQNLAPEELRYLTVVRITPKAREQWHQRMAKHAHSRTVKIEHARQVAQSRAAARASVESPNHIQKQKKRAKKNGRT
jgi:hypothetical protein